MSSFKYNTRFTQHQVVNGIHKILPFTWDSLESWWQMTSAAYYDTVKNRKSLLRLVWMCNPNNSLFINFSPSVMQRTNEDLNGCLGYSEVWIMNRDSDWFPSVVQASEACQVLSSTGPRSRRFGLWNLSKSLQVSVWRKSDRERCCILKRQGRRKRLLRS